MIMCLATPVKIKKVSGTRAILENGREVDISLVATAQAGDWMLCHADLAINTLSSKEAREILGLNAACHHQGTK